MKAITYTVQDIYEYISQEVEKAGENALKRDIRLLLEAYRRQVMFNREKPLTEAWLGCGTCSTYGKSPFFQPLHGDRTPRITHWWLLTGKGVRVLKATLKKFPAKWNAPGWDKLNLELFEA